MNSSLPLQPITKGSDKDVRQFFDKYFTKTVNIAQNDLDSVVGFFENRGFDASAALAVSVVLLDQAKKDGVKIFQLLDTLKKLDGTQLSVVIAEVLNYNRKRTSAIGFKRTSTVDKVEKRNILI
jgi:hypothetical protein